MTHEFTESASAGGGYWVTCSCGWKSEFHQTLKSRRKAKERHEIDVAANKIWYVLRNDILQLPTFATKRQALLSQGLTHATRIAPGCYGAAGGLVVTTSIERVALG